MKRIDVIAVSAGATLAVGAALALAAYATESHTPSIGPLQSSPFRGAAAAPAPASPLLALETAALTRQGIPPTRASLAIGVQSQIAQTDLVSKLEAAMAETFAGVWFEAATAQLHVGVTSPASRRVAEEVVARAGLADYVTVSSVHSTWAQLLAAQDEWDRKLESRLARSEVETGLVPQSNAVSVAVSSAAPAAVRAALEREAGSADVKILVSVVAPTQVASSPRVKSTACKPFTKDEAFCDKPITSGVTIGTSTVPAACTAGPMAIPRGATKDKTYLLTAGHCIGAIGESWFAINRNGSKGEIGKVKAFTFETKGDFAEIQVEPGFWTEADTKDPVFAVIAEWSTKDPTKSYPVNDERAPMMGATSCHDGQTSGESCGTISKVNVNANYPCVTVEGLVEVTGEGFMSIAGDSGGPYFFVSTKNELLIEGTESGGPNTKIAKYEPIATSLTKLGLELLTSKNEVRP